jgi:S-DNA-T family DNA segregation ATPase FtsK/SpoIIIE
MAAAAQARRFASPGLRGVIYGRFAELAGLALGLAGVALFVALASYDPRDPSLNTATARHATNLAGPIGAVVADLLLQGFGVAGGLPGVALLAWAWRVASRRGLGNPLLRVAALLAAMPVLAAVLAAVLGSVPGPNGILRTWPTVAGLGGAAGQVIGRDTVAAGREMLGPFGATIVCCLGTVLAGLLTVLAFGLTAGEWRAISQAIGRSVARGRQAAGMFGRLSARIAAVVAAARLPPAG